MRHRPAILGVLAGSITLTTLLGCSGSFTPVTLQVETLGPATDGGYFGSETLAIVDASKDPSGELPFSVPAFADVRGGRVGTFLNPNVPADAVFDPPLEGWFRTVLVDFEVDDPSTTADRIATSLTADGWEERDRPNVKRNRYLQRHRKAVLLWFTDFNDRLFVVYQEPTAPRPDLLPPSE
jgi:hypothetical protein